MDFPVLLDTYSAIKSVPPVEAFPFRASTMLMPIRKPPNTALSRISSKIGGREKYFRNKLVMPTCRREKSVNLGLMLR